MFGDPRPNVRSRAARKRFDVAVGQFCALVLAGVVAALLQVPLAADQVAQATAPPPPSELVQERTASSRTVDNHDGTFTTSLYSGPVHYRDTDGVWRPISSALVPSAEQGYTYENGANRFRTFFKQQLGADFLAVETGGHRFRLSLQGAADASAQTRARGLTYPSVFPGVDLQYDIQPDSVKETLVLANAQAPLSYRFRLTPPAGAHVHAARNRDGSWAFFAAPHARPVFVLEAPWVAEEDELLPIAAHASLEVTRDGPDFLLDLTLDGDWLRNPLRRFPVRVDPTITVQPAFQDASFNFNCDSCAGTTGERLSIGTEGLLGTWRSALQFSLDDIPAGASVSSAKLKLYFDGTCLAGTGNCGGTAHQIDALRMTSSWSSKSTPLELGFAPTPLASYTLPQSPSTQWMEWGLTGTVQAWVSGAQSNFGLLLKRASEPAAASGPKPPSRNYAPESTLGPKLEVTYNGNGGELLEPETVHSNGAELRWIPYEGPGASLFERYDVHRSATANFTPSESTLLTTIMESAVTSFRDTTAKAGATFTYKVVVNGFETNARTVTMPADGQARKTLRPDAVAGLDTYVTERTDSTDCVNRSSNDRLKVGTDAISIWRSLIRFYLADIVPDASISDVTLSLWHPQTTTLPLTVGVHRMTAHWLEGSGIDTCTGDGATWYEADGGLRWKVDGGDFAALPAASLLIPSGSQPGWSQWSLTSLAQQWNDGTHPNLGLLVKLSDESRVAGKSVDFYSSDFSVAPTLRPKLSVTYSDGNHAIAPTVAVSKPSPFAPVNGTSVGIAAKAFDDRRVDSVQFFANGNSVGTDTTEPFAATWDSTTVSNGLYNLTARATDDAGNQTTSAAVSVSVGNSAPPTTSITSPTGGVVAGTVPVSGNANDDMMAVTKVELYADGLLIGSDDVSPYDFSWNTLAPALPAYDGAHVLTTKAYDGHEHVTTSAPVNVTVDNRGTSWYSAEITTATLFPERMDYVPGAQTQQQYDVDVQVMNTGAEALPASKIVLRARWMTVSGEPVIDGGEVTFPMDLQPFEAQTVRVTVEPPSLPSDLARDDYRLRFDLFDTSNETSPWFAQHGNQPLEDFVPVGDYSSESTLGIEPYFEYETERLGLGMENLVNVATGNSIVRWKPFQAPGVGLSTDLELTYNSLDQRQCAPPSRCPLGPGWSIAVSSLTRIGAFQFGGPQAATAQHDDFTLIDADGTAHRFTWEDDPAPLDGHWEAPAGVHLYLHEVDRDDLCLAHPVGHHASWAVTRPDRVTYFFDEQGGSGRPKWPVAVRDKNGNELCFKTGGNPPGAQVQKVFDEGGRFFEIHYNDEQSGGATEKVAWIQDHLEHRLEFSYDDNDQLEKVLERGGTDSSCSNPQNRCVRFEYEDDRLERVIDARNNDTEFVYHGDGKLHKRFDRANDPETTFTYYPGPRETHVVKPLRGTTVYHYRTDKSVDSVQNGLGETTTTEWWPSRHVKKVTEPGPRFGYTEYSYDQNGLVTSEGTLTDANGPQDDEVSRTVYTYDHFQVDDDDVNESISQLKTRTDPNGVPSEPPDDCDAPPEHFVWRYCYDGVGNLTRVVDPTTAETLHEYNGDGTVSSTTDPNGHVTSFEQYDDNGFPQLVRQKMKLTDPDDDLITRYDYDEDGLLLWRQDPIREGQPCGDPRDCKTVFDYDRFHRQIEQSSPKMMHNLARTQIWTETEYDKNDNVVTQRQASYARGAGPATTFEYTDMDQQEHVTDPEGSETTYEYDDANRLSRTTQPRGIHTAQANDFVTENVYDNLDRIVTEKRYPCSPAQDADCAVEEVEATRKTYSCYQTGSGDLLWVTAPNTNWNGGDEGPDCNLPDPIPSHTTRFTYDDGHRQLAETTQAGAGEPLRTSSQEYDPNGNVITETDEDGTPTQNVYSERDEILQSHETFQKGVQNIPTRIVTTAYVYDDVGNLIREVSPRAWDSCEPAGCDPGPDGDYVTEYIYDQADRQIRIDLPTKGTEPRTYIHNGYDKNGNVTTTTLPVTDEDPGSVDLDKQTTYTYWDAGWIRSINDNIDAPVSFDYSAEGWQIERVSEHRQGTTMRWEYNSDGTLRRAVDLGGHDATYAYDLDKNVTRVIESRGQGQRPQTYTVESGYNGFDEPTKTRAQNEQSDNWTFTASTYDRNGNVSTREDDGEETNNNTLVQQGRLNLFSYDWVDEQTRQDELGTDWLPSDPQPSLGDRRLDQTYDKRGWRASETLRRYAASSWVPKRTTSWVYRPSGDLAILTTQDGQQPTPNTLEHHTFDYEEDVDGRMVYVNGNRTRDSFTLHGPGQGTDCEQTCTTKYKYGVRENLTKEARIRGEETTGTCHRLDAAMNVVDEWVLDEECPEDEPPAGPADRHYVYPLGNRLTQMEDNQAQVVRNYFYDDEGNLHCVTRSAQSTSADCPDPIGGSVSANLEERYGWHYQNRLQSYRRYGIGARSATYELDPFDRVVLETEHHPDEPDPDRETRFTYQGVTNLVSSETRDDGQQKSYTYDTKGGLVTLTVDPGNQPSEEFGYVANAHSDVSLLLNLDTDQVGATYGYKPYGGTDDGLMRADTDPVNPINPYRFNAKRYDSGSTTLDMGARRYSADVGRFVQRDTFSEAINDLGLSRDMLSYNRYAFGAGDPINQIEDDGHRPRVPRRKITRFLKKVGSARSEIRKRLLERFICGRWCPLDRGLAVEFLRSSRDSLVRPNAVSYVNSFDSAIYMFSAEAKPICSGCGPERYYRYYSDSAFTTGNFFIGHLFPIKTSRGAQRVLNLPPANLGTRRQTVYPTRGALFLYGKIEGSDPDCWAYGNHPSQLLAHDRADWRFGRGAYGWWRNIPDWVRSNPNAC
jgi:RHS repeat-associated protein